jgi:DNA-binding PadR family transcriptional regulator
MCVVKEFMGIFILAELKKESMSGYDDIKFILNKFAILLSSGTVCSLLYSMERESLIKGPLERAKKSLHTNRKGKTKHKSHHQRKRGN